MYINNIVRNTFSAIKNVENKSREIKNILNGIILSCYNTIISFIKPSINIKNDFLGLRKNISNVENKNNQSESTPVKLDNKEKTDKKENDEVFDKPLSEAQRKIKSDEIKSSIINDIISFLKEIPELEKEKITEFKKELEFHSKWILFSGNKISLDNSKNNFLESIADSLLNSDDKIKSSFGSIDSYKFFLKESIDNTVENIIYKN